MFDWLVVDLLIYVWQSGISNERIFVSNTNDTFRATGNLEYVEWDLKNLNISCSSTVLWTKILR
jgi:hypothetical protein